MKLSALISHLDYRLQTDLFIDDIDISDIATDSRKALENTVFICIAGASVDGHSYAKQAYQNGCRAFIAEHPLDLAPDAVTIIVPDTRIALAAVSDTFFDHPSKKLTLIGITGTKGKTSVTTIASAVLNLAGLKTATIGTNGIVIDGVTTPTLNTTPDAYELNRAFAKMVEAGVKCAIIEVSSQALYMKRVFGLEFFIGVFTNLSHDHIGGAEHPDFEHYKNSKAKLFSQCKYGIFNSDDEHYFDVAKNARCICSTFGTRAPADYLASDIEMSQSGDMSIQFSLKNNGMTFPLQSCIPGLFSVYNALAVFAIATLLNVPHEKIAEGLKSAYVPGRFEIVGSLPGITTIIDYAHNPLSLKNVLTTLRAFQPKRIVCLFGCVGGRTKTRREEMGKIASEYADFCILTSDNPDFEPPLEIIADIEKGFANSSCPYRVIADRSEAIRYALENSCSGDVIILAGKGHETFQLIEGERVPFSEKEIVLEFCENALGKADADTPLEQFVF